MQALIAKVVNKCKTASATVALHLRKHYAWETWIGPVQIQDNCLAGF